MKKVLSVIALGALAATLVMSTACGKPEEKKPEVKTEAPKVVEEKASTSTTTTTGTSTAPGGTMTTATTVTTATTASTASTK